MKHPFGPHMSAVCLGMGVAWSLLSTPFAAMAASATPSNEPPLPASVQAALAHSGVPASAVSLLVWPVDAAAPRLAHRAEEVRSVASVMKLFTTGAALQTLSPAFTWKTEVGLGGPLRADGTLHGPLYLRGEGDPSLTLERVQLMAHRWRAGGLRDILGDIVLDHSSFSVPAHDPKAFDGQGLKPYNAGPDALLLNLNAFTLRLAPDASQSERVRVSMEPELDGVTLDASLQAQANAPCGDWRAALDLRLEALPLAAGRSGTDVRADWVVRLRGNYPLSCGEREWPVLWQGDGPGDHAQRLLSRTWRKMGGQLQGLARPGLWPEGQAAWQTWTSPPLGVVVRDINKFSNNVMARQLFLTMARSDGRHTTATLEQARQAVSQQVQGMTRDALGRSPCDGPALVLDNGSGLSRSERSSAMCLGRWLQVMWRSPVMPDLIASLPITGQDGTTRRWRSAAGRAHLKTGSLEGVAALAGYVDADAGQRHIVVAVVNHPKADAARSVLEALVNWALQDEATP